MIDHRRHPKNLTRLIAHKCNIFIMIVLITFQNRYQDLHCQLLCQILMRLKICRFQNLRIIIKHLAVIQIIIDLHVLVRILSEKLQQIHQLLALSISKGDCCSIIIIFSCLRLIPLTKSQPILRYWHKIRVDHPRPEHFRISKQRCG